MSFPNESELSRLRKKLRKCKNNIHRLENVLNPNIWDTITLRLEKLNLIKIEQDIEQFITEMYNQQ